MDKNKKISSSESQDKMVRYLQLDKLFRSEGGVTIKDILTDPNIGDISERQIRYDIGDFKKSFNAKFVANLRRGNETIYKYENAKFSIFPTTSDMDTIREAIEKLSAFKGDPRYDLLRYYLIEIQKGLSDSSINAMSFDSNNDYEGLEHIEILLDAIINRYPVKIKYKPFGQKEYEVKTHPYHLRQYNKRWFLFGYVEEKDRVYNYPLDRIVEVKHLQKTYREGNIDFDEYFDEIVGVTNDQSKQVEVVILKVDKKSYDYIRTKPIHYTQTELKALNTDEYFVVRLKLKINMELKMVLFSYADAIEVLEPAWLRDEFINIIKKMEIKYEAPLHTE